MNNLPDQFVYMMANEKIVNMIQTIDNTLTFMDEYKVTPDDEVRKALIPIIKQLETWIK
jgi:hypothetical protein